MSGKKQKFKPVRLPIINERFLMVLLRALCGKRDISRKSLANIKDLMSILDIKYYSNDSNVYSLLKTIEIAIKHRTKLQEDIDNSLVIAEAQLTLSNSYADSLENIVFPILMTSNNVSDIEMDVINTNIDLYLKYGSILSTKDELSDIFTNIISGDMVSMKETIDKFRFLVQFLSEEFRKSDNTDGDIIHSIDDDFFDLLAKTFVEVKSDKNTLKTGLQMFNETLSENGGFLPGNFYMIYASINSFKSALLQYIVKWIRKYNSENYEEDFKKTGKRPTILFYSLENSKFENSKREFTMETGKDMKDFTNVEEMMNEFRVHYDSTNSIIDVVTVYAKANTVKMSDINKQIEVLKENNHNVIAVVVDYIELIRAEDEDLHLDNRLKLANISTAMHVLAVFHDLVMISAHQINRGGEDMMQEQRERGISNVVRSLGRRFIGEAYAIDKPVDVSFYIALERSIYDNKLYLTMKRDKSRSKRTGLDYFVVELENGFYIKDDIYLDSPLTKKAIMPSNDNDLDLKVSNKISPNAQFGKRGLTELARKSSNTEKKEVKPIEVVKKSDIFSDGEDLFDDYISMFSFIDDSDDYFESFENLSFITPFNLEESLFSIDF